MKTTLELPDDLFVEAKAVAARRRITLKALFTRALERELHPEATTHSDVFALDPQGWPVLKHPADGGVTVTDDLVRRLRESEGI